jgi:hypothetical protein
VATRFCGLHSHDQTGKLKSNTYLPFEQKMLREGCRRSVFDVARSPELTI